MLLHRQKERKKTKERKTENKPFLCSRRNLRSLMDGFMRRERRCQASEEQHHYLIHFTPNRVGQMDLVCVCLLLCPAQSLTAH